MPGCRFRFVRRFFHLDEFGFFRVFFGQLLQPALLSRLF
jgi:hypothetical protein